jgi:hypothetical protein
MANEITVKQKACVPASADLILYLANNIRAEIHNVNLQRDEDITSSPSIIDPLTIKIGQENDIKVNTINENEIKGQ